MTKKYHGICPTCSLEFHSVSKVTKFCSIRCSKIGNINPNWKGGHKAKNCKTCNKQIPVHTHVNRDYNYCSIRCSKIKERNPNWLGEKAGYSALHTWVANELSGRGVCLCCGKIGKTDAANISGKYKRELSDWEWLCRKCHMIKDGRMDRLIERNKTKSINDVKLDMKEMQ